MLDFTLNLWPVIVASVANIILGFVWYSQAVFGKQWLAASQMNMAEIEKDKSKGMSKTYVCMTILALLTSYALSVAIQSFEVSHTGGALSLALFLSVGFVGLTSATNHLFSKNSFTYFLINIGYTVVGFVIMSLILFYMIG